MKILSNCIGLMAILCVFGGADAATRAGGSNSRVSVNSATALRRLPTLISTTNSSASSSSSSSGSSLMTMTECVEAYTSCIKDPEVCGANFEECTTPELFYAKKPHCNSVLLQCGSDGINALFGTSNTTYLTIDNVNVYPTAGSILGQFIAAGEINNRLDRSACVKRYTACLHRENVCGEDFELCTSHTEFKKQRIHCESTLVRCVDEGKIELFGQTDTSGNPQTGSRVNDMIIEGAGLATINAVSTCAKVADQCILAACGTNPYKCIINSSLELVDATDRVNDNQNSNGNPQSSSEVMTAQYIKKYIKGACMDTIGGNKYCYMSANDGTTPTPADLRNEEIREEVYEDIYALRMNTTLRDKIQKLADTIDTRTKDTCYDTIKSCAMRSCGGGLGSACYKQVFGAANNFSETNLINQSTQSYNEIKRGCSAIVNTDPACMYAAASSRHKAYQFGYQYSYTDAGAFNTLFPDGNSGSLNANMSDPIGAVEKLTSLLQNSYNDAAIAELKNKCRNTAISCIRSMCGADFTGCYRNRTDVMTDTYNTAGLGTGSSGSSGYSGGTGGSMSGGTGGGRPAGTTTGSSDFDNSMNKVGGVLDFTIIRGLCINAIRESSACDEHLKLEAYTVDEENPTVWGGAGNVREAWVDAVSGGYTADKVLDEEKDLVKTGCTVSDDKDGLCDDTVVQECNTVDENGCVYDKDYFVGRTDYKMNMAADTLFREVLGNLELEAQAKYNQKLTKEQNMCRAANEGGIMGRKDMASTYMWAKLRGRRVPKNYAVNGLKSTEFVESNDLYGSFCRARITIQSDDPDIQRYLQERKNTKDWTTAYFAVGDVFTCGSWIPQKDLENIAEAVSQRKVYGADAEKGKADVEARQKRNRGLITAASVITGGLGTAYLADVVQSKNFLGGLLSINRNTDEQNARNVLSATECSTQYETYRSAVINYNSENAKQSPDNSKKAKLSSAAYSAALQMRASALTIVNRRVLNKNSNSNTEEYRDEGVQALRTAISSIGTNCTDSDSAVSTECEAAVTTLGGLCGRVEEFGGQLANYGNNSRRQAINLGVGIVGAAVSGVVANNLTKSVQESNMTAEERAAFEQFMSEIGNHIYCFVGADEAGTYGDLIQLSID